MKTLRYALLIFLVSLTVKGFSQTTAPADFFAGKWEISISGTPNGDVKMLTNLVRKDGKLTGELTDAGDANKPKMAITKVDESANKLVIYFESSQAGELAMDLTKVDDDNLKGSVFNFSTTAKRIK